MRGNQEGRSCELYTLINRGLLNTRVLFLILQVSCLRGVLNDTLSESRQYAKKDGQSRGVVHAIIIMIPIVCVQVCMLSFGTLGVV